MSNKVTEAAPVIVSYTVNDNNSVTLTGTAEANSTVTVYDGQTKLGMTTANANGAWSYTTGSLASGTQDLTATATVGGNTSAASNSVTLTIGEVAVPTVVSVAASGTGITNGNGDLSTGSVVTLTLTMSEAVTVAGGTPTLSLDDGGTVTYTGGSGTNALTFSYTVAAGQNTPDLTVTAVNLNGATIAAGAGNAANFSGTLTPAGALQIDTTPPTVTSVATSGTGITNGSGDLSTGSVVTLTLTMSEAVTVAGGTPTLTLDDGGTATYTGGSDSNALTFSYTVAAGQNTPDLTVTAVNLNGATITDGAGNNANLAGTLTPADTLLIDAPTPTTAVSAKSFVQSIGVNIQMWEGAYWNTSLVISDLDYLGVDHVRDALTWAISQSQMDQTLAAAGIKFDFVLPGSNVTQFISLVDAQIAAYPGSVSAIEGPNEVDLWPITYNGGTSLADQAALQQALYAAVQADPNLNGIPVYNLTLGYPNTSNYAQLGNLSSAANYGNVHPYMFDADTPAEDLSSLLSFSQLDAPGLPVVITETGYETNAADTYSGVDPTAQAKLTLDTLMDAFKDGVSETYLYNLLDDAEQYFGLFTADGTPKLAATAIHDLTSLVVDPGSTTSFAPGSLSYAVPNLPNTGNQLLLEKSTGTFDLVLWAESQIWNPNTQSEVVAPSEATTVDFGQTQSVVLIFDPIQGATPIAAYLNTQSVQVTLTDDPIIVELPSATPALATPTINGYASGGGTAADGLTLTGTAVAHSTVLVFDGTTQIGSATANAGGTWSFVTGSLAGGTNAFTAMAVDTSGDVSALSTALDVTIKTASAATVPVPIIYDYSITGTNQVILTGTAEANTTVDVFDGTTALGTTTANASGAWSYTTASLVNGDYTFTATAIDASGNTSAFSNSIDPIISTPPTVASVAIFGTGIVNGNGDVSTGSVVTFTLNMSEATIVADGTPTLSLSDGEVATYTGGSGTNSLTFSYTVVAGDTSSDLTATAFNGNGAMIEDTAGDALTNGTIPNPNGVVEVNAAPSLQIDPPTVTSLVASPASGDLDAGKTVTLTLNLSEAVTVAGGTPTLTVNDGATATYTGGSGSDALTFSYTVAAGQNTSALTVTAVNLNAATITDSAGNVVNTSLSGLTQTGPQIDTTAPTITSLVKSPASGDLNAGKTVTLTLNLSEAVTVAGGTPTLTLNDGATATYTGGSGTDALTFSYAVAAGQNTSALTVTAVNLGSATVTDSAGNVANLSLSGLTQAGPQIDTTTPTVTSVVTSGSGITNGSGDLDAGKTVTLALNLSEAVTVVGGTPTLTLNDGATATYTGGSGTNALIFSYTVAVGQNTSDLTVTAVNLNAATVTDGAGNVANLTGAVGNPIGTLQIDTTTPTLTSVVASGGGITNGSGDLDAGKSVTLTLALSEAVTVAGGTPTLTLNDGGTASYTGGSGSDALTFSYTVAAGQNTSDLTATAVNLNGATLTDGAGNAANFSLSGLTQTGPQIDTTAPTITSLVKSPASGDLDAGKTVTLTLTLSENVTVNTAGGTPTLTLNDGATATYTGGSGSDALTFSYTVAAGQNTATLTATAVNLNGAAITDGAGNVANLSLSGLTQTGPQIDTTPPAPPVITSDTVNGDTVTLTGTAAANITVTVYDGQTDLGTTTANASGAWSFTTGALENGSQTLTATATDAAGNTSAASNAVDPSIGALTELTGAQTGTHSVANGVTLEITGTVDNTGTITLNASGGGADLAIVGSATLTGAGKVTLSNNAGNEIGSNGASASLTNVNNTISGAGTIGDSYLTLINEGAIDANDSLALAINTGANTITNAGTLEATSTGGLDIDSNVSNRKTIEALGSNAKVVIASTVTDTTAGKILASGTGAQVDLDNATIIGGTLQTSGSSALIETVGGSANAFDGGTISSGSTVEINSGTVLTLGGSVTNSGTLLVNGGTLDVDGALTGGTTEISGAGRIVIAPASKENVDFLAKSTGQLVLDQATSYTGEISGFGTTQSIDLTDIDFAAGVKLSYASNNRQNTSGVLTITEGTTTVRLELEGSYTLANFKVASDGDGGTLLTDPSLVTQQPGNAPATIGNDTVLEINTRDSGNVTFTGTTGTLWLDQPATFTGKVSGLGAQNGIDLSGIAFNAQTTLGYSPNSNDTGGILSIANGANIAKIALLGSYMASSFVMESDNHGGTMLLADAVTAGNQPLLTNPNHA